jgi:hypothetical protein
MSRFRERPDQRGPGTSEKGRERHVRAFPRSSQNNAMVHGAHGNRRIHEWYVTVADRDDDVPARDNDEGWRQTGMERRHEGDGRRT